MKLSNNGQYYSMTKEELIDHTYVAIPYKDRVINRIRAVYSVDDEIAILRQRDTKPEEFEEYNRFVEQIKLEEKSR